MFKALEYMFQGLEHMFQALGQVFQALEYKISLGVNYFSSKDKQKYVGNRIMFAH